MKMPKGFKTEARKVGYPQLPAGTYVAGIKNVKVDEMEPNSRLVIRLDIIEGECTGYYTKRYERDSQNAGFNQGYQAKYKGDFKLWIPTQDDCDEVDDRGNKGNWRYRLFNQNMNAIEQSNPGVVFDWDKIWAKDFAFLKGKIVGINVRDANFNGNPFTEIGQLEDAEAVRKGIVKTMKPKKDSGSASATEAPATSTPAFTQVETDELPF